MRVHLQGESMKKNAGDEWGLREIILYSLVGIGVVTTIFAVIQYFGYGFSSVGCTGSMDPSISCHCPILLKYYDSAFEQLIDPRRNENKSSYEIVENIIIENIEVGDVVVFESCSGRIIHRVIDNNCEFKYYVQELDRNITLKGVETMGDNNLNISDGCIPYYKIRSKLLWKGC